MDRQADTTTANTTLTTANTHIQSVMHGQCDVSPTVTFAAAEHHRPLTGTTLCCLVTGAQGWLVGV